MKLSYHSLPCSFSLQKKPKNTSNKPLSIIKSHSLTSLPIINKSKKLALINYIENVKKDKQSLETQFNDNYPNFQHFFFDFSKKSSEERIQLNKELKQIANHLSAKFLSRAEIQKFVNEDLVEKKKERIEREIKKIKKAKNFKNYQSKRKNTRVDEIVFEIFLSYLNKSDTEKLKKFKEQELFQRYEARLFQYVEKKCEEIYKKKIEYRTGSIIKSDNRIALGHSKVRLVFVPENKLFQVFYCLDYFEEENEKIVKKFMNIPMGYNPNYHKEFYLRSLGENKFRKGSQEISDKEYLSKMFHQDKLSEKLLSAQVIYVREHTISLTDKGRLKIGLSYKEEKEYEEIPITEENSLGVDLGGKIDNAIALSSEKFIPMEYLYGISEKLLLADKIEEKDTRESRYREISKEAKFKMNEFISSFLNEMAFLKISHLALEKLDPWNVKWRDKSVEMKANRVFRLLRASGFANLLRIQARNKGIIVHTLPSFYTSQRCPHCGHISRNNCLSDRVFKCEKCGHTDDRDYNAAKNLKLILLHHKRFLGKILKKNSVYEQELIPEEYIKKELVKKLYGEKLCEEEEELNSSCKETLKISH